MRILIKRTVVNGIEYVTYPFNEKECTSLSERLREEFGTQGVFYSKVFQISEKDSIKAGWHLDDSDFESLTCIGWAKFIKDKGCITKTEVIEEVLLSELLFKE